MLFFMLDSSGVLSIILRVLLVIGMYQVLKKIGERKWWALVPGIRDYMLGRGADRRAEGIMYMVMEIIQLVVRILMSALKLDDIEVTDDNAMFILIFLGAIALASIGSLVYTIRIFSGLCERFGVSKKRCIWMILLIGRAMPLLIWGFGKKYVAKPKEEEADAKEGAAVSGIKVKAEEEGLSINIEERTASDLFKKKVLLRDIHLNIRPGHMVLLLGGSGAGKTTFVNAVNGYEKAKADIVLNGTSIYDDYDQMKFRIGFVPQMDLMRGTDTVLATVMDAAKLRLPSGLSSAERKERAEEALRFFGLEPVKDRLCDKLSGGQRKRLSICMEYISNPDLFILDEPDSGLDGVMARELMEGLRHIADQGKIVIVITHSPDRVIDLFDDVIVLAKDSGMTGRLTYFGPVGEAKKFFDRENMEQIVLRINRKEEGGEGMADAYIEKYAEVCHG